MLSKRDLSNIHIKEKAESIDYKPINAGGAEGVFPVRVSRSNHAS